MGSWLRDSGSGPEVLGAGCSGRVEMSEFLRGL